MQNGCGSETWDTTIVIVAPPQITLNKIKNYCEEATLNFDASMVNFNAHGGTISSVQWNFPGATPATFSGEYPTGIYYNTVGIHNINVTVTNECGEYKTGIFFEIQQQGQLNLPDDVTICTSGDAFTLGGNPSGGTWSIDNGGVIVGNNVFDVNSSGLGVYTLTYSYTDDDGCSGSDTKTIIVNELPEVDAGPDQTVCLSATGHTLTGHTPSGGTWTGVGVSSNGIFTASNTAGAGDYELYYTYTDPNTSCSDIDTLIMTVTPTPVINAGEDEIVCITNSAYTLTAGIPEGGTWTGQGIIDPSGIFDPNTAGVVLN